jgi:Papain-like cysteine protease AvrRpt2
VTRPASRPRRLRRFVVGAVLLALVGGTLGTFLVATDTFGAGERWQSVLSRVDRFLAGPVPDRPTIGTVLVTEPPETPSPTPEITPVPATPAPGATPTPTPAPTPTPTPRPKRVAMDVDIVDDHEAVFASQAHKDWCAPAGVQMVLAVLGLVNPDVETQREIAGRVRRWESYDDSHNGDWGPAAMALALKAYGAEGYEVRAFETRSGALRNAAVAIQETGSPVILLAWKGAHTWVMTGYRADADPAIFKDAEMHGAYILDPWYPRISSIWGRSDPPGTFQDAKEMRRNFLEWKRPEGRYPDRDGLYITVAPTIPREDL